MAKLFKKRSHDMSDTVSPSGLSFTSSCGSDSDAIRPSSARGSRKPRIVIMNVADLGTNRYRNNKIRTTKYTPWNFIFLFLWYQFTGNIFNLAFLVGSLINLFPEVQIYNPGTTFAPLIFVLAVSAIRELAEDTTRARSDRAANRAPVLAARGGEVAYRRTADLIPGDIVYMRNGDAVPCDLVLLATGDPEGRAYVQTMNLDGESNLKLRRPLPSLHDSGLGVRTLHESHLVFKVEQPNADLNSFNGAITILNDDDVAMYAPDDSLRTSRGDRKRELYMAVGRNGTFDAQTHALGTDNLLLRGCTLRDTPLAVGLAVYCGHETKSVLNMATTRNKLSEVTRMLNREIKALIVCLFCFTFVSASLHLVIADKNRLDRAWYLGLAALPAQPTAWQYTAEWFIMCTAHAILFGLMIPISLFVSIDMSRYVIARIMERDPALTLPGATAERRFAVRSSAVLEELGYIEYLFTDKTGTLTENEMVGDTVWTVGGGVCRAGCQLSPEGTLKVLNDMDGVIGRAVEPFSPGAVSPSFISYPGQEPATPPTPAPAAFTTDDLMEALAICHSVQISASGAVAGEQVTRLQDITALATNPQPEGFVFTTACPPAVREALMPNYGLASPVSPGPRKPGVTIFENEAELCRTYAAESPDEKALVELAGANGWTVLERRPDGIEVCARCESCVAASSTPCRVGLEDRAVLTYRTPVTVPFNSDRKRMSVLVQHGSGYRLYMKGADAIVLDRCVVPSDVQRAADAVLNAAAELGLRTLCYAQRDFNTAEGDIIVSRYRRAMASHDAAEKTSLLTLLASEIECECTLVGVTAIEDRLQDGVPETLSFLREAGIRPWMLTGDKLQTAVCIGRSAQLIGPGQPVVCITGDMINRKSMIRTALDLAHTAIDTVSGDAAAFAANNASYQYVDGLLLPRITSNTEDGDVVAELPPPPPPKRTFTISKMFPAFGEMSSLTETLSVSNNRPALVIDGNALSMALSTDPDRFVHVASAAGAVIVCRASPKQKADCVTLMKNTGKIVAAVGDGANDVSMIQVASVGIGIAGREGLQASRCADFAMARFRYLKRLFAVHGRYNYHRMCSIINYSFYKNMSSIIGSFGFGFVSMFSAATALDSLSMMFYNLFFTSLPIFAVCMFDRDLPEFVLENAPIIYRSSQRRAGMNPFKFVRWEILGFYTGMVAFAVAYLYTGEGLGRQDGRSDGLGTFNLLFVAIVFGAVTIRVCLQCVDLSFPFFLCLVLTILAYFVFQYMGSNGFGDWGARYVFVEVISSGSEGSFWLASVFGIALCVLPSLIYQTVYTHYFPSTTHIVAEAVRQHGRVLGIWPRKHVPLPVRWEELGRSYLEEVDKEAGSPIPK